MDSSSPTGIKVPEKDVEVRVRIYVSSRTLQSKNGLFANEEESIYGSSRIRAPAAALADGQPVETSLSTVTCRPKQPVTRFPDSGYMDVRLQFGLASNRPQGSCFGPAEIGHSR
jgi:hypothetical protein